MTGLSEILVLVAAVVVFFSLRKLPQLGSALGDSVRSFRKGLRGESRPVRDVSPLNPETPEKIR